MSLAIRNKKGKKITVEVDNLNQLKQIMGLKFNTVLFDNMNNKTLKAGVKMAKKILRNRSVRKCNAKIS